jgi:hypothetical protein
MLHEFVEKSAFGGPAESQQLQAGAGIEKIMRRGVLGSPIDARI